MVRATYSPIWIAAGGIQGSGPPGGWWNRAAAPSTQTSGRPGRFENRAGGISRRPNYRLGRDGPVGSDDESRTNVGDHRLGAYLHTQPAQVELGLVAQAGRVGGKQAGAALQEHHRGFARI